MSGLEWLVELVVGSGRRKNESHVLKEHHVGQ